MQTSKEEKKNCTNIKSYVKKGVFQIGNGSAGIHSIHSSSLKLHPASSHSSSTFSYCRQYNPT